MILFATKLKYMHTQNCLRPNLKIEILTLSNYYFFPCRILALYFYIITLQLKNYYIDFINKKFP